MNDFLLKEDDSYLLLETGDKIILVEYVPPPEGRVSCQGYRLMASSPHPLTTTERPEVTRTLIN